MEEVWLSTSHADRQGRVTGLTGGLGDVVPRDLGRQSFSSVWNREGLRGNWGNTRRDFKRLCLGPVTSF